MAYVIGSQKGKDKAKSMKTGEKYNASDGSTWTKESDGSVTVKHNGQTFNNAYPPSSSGGSSSGGSSKSNNSPYSGGSLDYSVLGKQQMANGASWRDVQNTLDSRVNKASNTPGLEQYAYDDNYWAMYKYIQDQKKASNTTAEDILSWNNDYNLNNEKPTTPKKDPRIDKILNEILNRDAFSYDVMNDPLYQQYKQMYQREGDRAMRETMAEAAAGAGGMNTYAVTAAQQANSYYNSQLNDRIPELYQLAYNMYLQDIENKVQDLGILQDMDNTQYNRYRDTMNDWYNDKKFAYGAYQDAVHQGNWQTTFDNNEYWKNKEWNYNDMWKNKEWDYNDMWKNKEWDYNDMWANKEWDYNDMWKNKEWDYNDMWKNKEWSKEEQDDAKAEVEYWMSNGIMPDDELIAKSGMNKATIEQRVAQVKADQAAQNTTSSTVGGSGGNDVKDKGKGGGGGYDNGSLTTAQIKQLQEELGVTADGLWGSGSKDAAGGLSADDAWRKYFGDDGGNDDTTWTKGMTDLGLGLVFSPDLLVDLEEAGAIYEENGKLKWANGWNAGNYEEKLRNRPFPNLISPLSW